MSRTTADESSGAHFRVQGLVQGVGFRWWTQQIARELNLTGTVRNLPDESVEIIAFGTPAAIADLRRIVHEGPASARVVHVDESPVASDTPVPAEFSIVA